MLPTVEESNGYDFQDPENIEKWRGLFVNALRKMLESTHVGLTAEASALSYVETLLLQVLSILTAPPSPLTVQDLEERVNRKFPKTLEKWVLGAVKDTSKRKLQLPHDKIHSLLQKEVLLHKIDNSVSTFITATLEYIAGELLKLAGNFVKKISQKSGCDTITLSDVKTAMCADKVLMEMFQSEKGLLPARRGSLSYPELVRMLLHDEKSFLRDLNLIVRVFKVELEDILSDKPEVVNQIFGNVMDIYELTVTLLGNLEDAIEMAQDSPTPCIGNCFEELAEVEEFRAYVWYANNVTTAESRDALQNIVDDPQYAERLESVGKGFRLATKYYLPNLLLAPVSHVFLYHYYVQQLLHIAAHSDDTESFKQVECNLLPIKNVLLKAIGTEPKLECDGPISARSKRTQALEKCTELSKLVDHWDNRDTHHVCNEFIREDTLAKVGPGKRIAERRVYLFDGLLLLCKPVTGLIAVNSGAQLLTGAAAGPTPLKVKEKLYVRRMEVYDRPDTDDARHLVELVPAPPTPPVVVACGSRGDKRRWLGDLLRLTARPPLEKVLARVLEDLERRHPLRLPPVELYKFAEPDSSDNIVLEERLGREQAPLIKGATLLKLVERLTYHVHADLALMRTFLTTYRSFCEPTELLRLLVERFNIPTYQQVLDAMESNNEADKGKHSTREDFKRYRKEFEQPVKFRVINVIRHWVDQHFYDFERDPELLEQLKQFLESVDGKPMKKWVQSVLKTIQRKTTPEECGLVCHVFDRPAPPVVRHLADPVKFNWHPLSLHPVELARQITLLEGDLYRQVKPSELVGAVWTKKDKEKTSPNLLKIIKHTTNLTRWMEKCIVESGNIEERAGVCVRFLEMARALHVLHNFNGVLAIVAGFGSAAVHRLRTTVQLIPVRLQRELEEFRSLNSDHFRKYQERLRSINPPCVPFFGMYLTNILHIEEGNLDFLPNSELINFSKRRKVAEITGEIQQYQNQPYCLTVEAATRAFLESLDPFPGMDDNEITNYLYSKSLEIEPRQPTKQLPKFPRKYPELSLKPVKVSRRSHDATDDNGSVSQLSPPGWDSASVSSLSLSSFDTRSLREDRPLGSPRLQRSPSGSLPPLSLLDKGLALFDKNKYNSRSGVSRDDREPPSPRDRQSERQSPRLDTPPSPRPALSPRAPTLDRTERVPPLLPRTSTRRPPSPHEDLKPPEPPERPPPSPKHVELQQRVSPSALAASASPGVTDRSRFTFSLAPSPSAPPPLTPHSGSSSGGTCPPPLPPRRRKDVPPNNVPARPPPLPPRPPPAPALQRVGHSALLQRRHASSVAPKLPPKPPPPAVAPRT